MKRYIVPMVALFVLAIPVLTYTATWQMDPDHSSFQFKIRHLTVSNVKGDFSKLKGVVMIDDQDIARLKIEVVIDAASVNTGHAQRDEHLRGPDFFNVAKYPTLTEAEVQALVSPTRFAGNPRRMTIGLDHFRTSLLLA